MKYAVKLGLIIIFTGMSCMMSVANTIENPCGGAAALLNVIDRPTVGDSACVVPFKKIVIETGYQYQQLRDRAESQQNYPETELRIGLPADNELVILLPNHINQSPTPYTGNTASTIGIKHEIGYTKYWVTALETLFTLPNGSSVFGSKGTGAALNGIISYTFNPQINLTLMMGVTSETQSSSNGGQRFSSLNPDFVFTYAFTEKFNLYGEIYGQTRTSPREGNSFNVDGGIIYLLFPKLSIDLEVGQRLNGNLGGFNQYIGTGLAVML